MLLQFCLNFNTIYFVHFIVSRSIILPMVVGQVRSNIEQFEELKVCADIMNEMFSSFYLDESKMVGLCSFHFFPIDEYISLAIVLIRFRPPFPERNKEFPNYCLPIICEIHSFILFLT